VSPTLDAFRRKHAPPPPLSRDGRSTCVAVAAAFALLVVLIGSGDVSAQERVVHPSSTQVFWGYVSVPAGATWQAETTNLSGGCDTVLHVFDVTAQAEVAWNDDYLWSWRSLVSWTNTSGSARLYELWVRAASFSTSGTADLLVNGTLFAASVPVGGNLVDVVNGTPYLHETVSLPSGPTRTLVVGLTAAGQMTGRDITGAGVGNMSRYQAVAATTHVLVGTWPGDAAGGVRLVSHNPANDPDNDGVDTDVENAVMIQSCSGVGPCVSNVHYTTRDTDRDGITDGAEIFGIDAPAAPGAGPMHLPRWGADPRHKDIFVEVDFADTLSSGSNPLALIGLTARNAWAAAIAAAFNDPASGAVRNANSLTGVKVHLDIGIDPPAFTNATLYGNWGGGGTRVDWNGSQIVARNDAQDVARSSIFRYAIATPGGGGNANNGAFAFGFGGTGSGASGNPGVFVHELGHTANLAHWGHDNALGDPVHGAPGYHSIMNYCFEKAGLMTFSDGNAAALAINPSNIDESFSVQGDIGPTIFNGAPWLLMTAGTRPDSIDFNRDGQMDDGIRGAPHWCSWDADQALFSDATDQVLRSGDVFPDTSPELTGSPWSRLFVFALESSALRYRSAPYSSTADASCPNGDGLRATTTGGVGCMTWTSSQSVSPPSGVTIASVSAASWNGLVVAIRGTNNRVYTGSWTGFTGSALTGWSGWTDHGVGYGEVELAVVHTNPTHFGASLTLTLYFLNVANNYVWQHTTQSPPSFTSPTWVRTSSGALVSGSIGADVAAWPTVETLADYASVATGCGAFPDATGAVQILCLDRSSSNRYWRDISASAFNITGSCTGCIGQRVTVAKPALRFHIVRANNGAPFYRSRRGQFWLSTTPNTNRIPDVSLSGPLNWQAPPFPNLQFLWVGKQHNAWSRILGGVAYYADLSIGGLKGVYVLDIDSRPQELRFAPFGDGGVDVGLRDVSDWQVMERGVCSAQDLRSNALCGSLGWWGY
jgi:hypothetical protein